MRWLWKRIRGGRLEASRAGWSTAVGLFVGSLPLYGLHFPVCIAITWPLRLDALIAYAAANISNPFVAPALVALEYEVGSLVLYGAHAQFDVAELRTLGVTQGLLQLAVGAIGVGLVLALFGGVATTLAVSMVQTKRRVELPATHRTRRRYRKLPRRERVYVALKLRFDPIFRHFADAPPDLGHVLDAGCGRGQLALFLLELGAARSVQGFDADGRKVALARAAARGKASFWRQSLVDPKPWPNADSVLLIDVLHYLHPREQGQALSAAAMALNPGGQLIIREVDAEREHNPIGRIAERIGCRLGINRADSLSFLRRRDLEQQLDALDFDVCEASRGKASRLANFLLTARKRTPATQQTSR